MHGVQVPRPVLKANEVRVRVSSTAVNRADTLQRKGGYAPPKGASHILGLECAGHIVELGQNVTRWSLGDRVMALLAGGGYAEEVAVDAGSCLAVPDTWSLDEAASFMETYLTVFLNIFRIGQPPQRGERTARKCGRHAHGDWDWGKWWWRSLPLVPQFECRQLYGLKIPPGPSELLMGFSAPGSTLLLDKALGVGSGGCGCAYLRHSASAWWRQRHRHLSHQALPAGGAADDRDVRQRRQVPEVHRAWC
jgi:Alcohol dehydrogenase GroES-like domain